MTPLFRTKPPLRALLVALSAGWLVAAAQAATPVEIEAAYAAKAGTAPDAARGQRLFTTAHGAEWRCATCHGERPVQAGSHAATGKSIAPLAPTAQASRFTDPAKVEKWFRRNCQDVLSRVCTDGEKADVIRWLRGLQP